MLAFLRKCLDKITPPPAKVEPYIPPKRKDEFDLLVDRWEGIIPSRLNRVFSSDMSILTLRLSAMKINEYRKYFESINIFFADDAMLKPVITAMRVETVYLPDFFLDINNNYLDPVVEFDRLKEQVFLFIRYFQKGTNNVDATFNTSRNLSLTRHLISEIDQLLKVFE